MILIQTDDFDAAALTETLRTDRATQAGAIVTFTGFVRDFAQGQGTASLHIEHYPGMCERELADIGEDAKSRWDINDYRIVHRVGTLEHGAQIVFVGVSSAHRGDAFRACEFIIDALKTRAPFWKRETLADGKQFWVQAKQSDDEKTRRWTDPAATSGIADKDPT